MKIALVADWLPVFAGAEHVIAEFHTLWPQAPIFTTIAQHTELGPLNKTDIRTGSLQKWFRITRNHRVLLPWMSRAIERIDLTGFDVVLSSSHAIGKGIIPPSNAVHCCYCHTPMRYAWEMEQEYLEDFRVPRFLQRHVRALLMKLRRWDLSTAKRVDMFIANSTETQNRIKNIYGRDSVVIHPPVQDRFFDEPLASAENNGTFLAIGRLVPYKRFDLLIHWANEHHAPLTIVGTGPDEKRLRSIAGSTVTFTGFVSNDRIPKLYRESRALLFPQHEDAGIVPLEAQACGTPVIAFGKGGILDTVRDGETGIFFEKQAVNSLHDAIKRFEIMAFEPEKIREHARMFSATQFRMKMEDVVTKTVRDFGGREI